ncbi:MAG: hypothetical protein U9R21_09725 [Candidatus Thermoplasmatota archaeon]|nr:hypothetical protein [Candidatus Thermoplasmatota archaeon]
MKRIIFGKNIGIIIAIWFFLSILIVILPSERINAGSYNGEDLALAILANQSTLISSSYTDTDLSGHRQATVLSSLGIISPTNGSTFAFFSTGIAGEVPVTTNGENPGNERGTWFKNKHGHPRDEATLTMILQVPAYMHYVYYDVQFFSTEYPEYVGTPYNDKLTIIVDSPSKGISEYIFDINSGYFVLESESLIGTGFNVFAQSGNPDDVDWIDTTPRTPGADAGASDLIPIGGASHPVSPYEQITVTINIRDVGDNQFDSAAFIDNLMFSGYAKTEIIARKTAQDLNGGDVECNDTIKYTVTISNTGTADQHNNGGNEFEDVIPQNATYVEGTATATSGTVNYDGAENKITWNGAIDAESSVSLMFEVTVNSLLSNGSLISNQGTVYWDSDEDRINDALELTDDPHIGDGIDQDGDGDTDDDDPTNLYVIAFEPPLMVEETFSDDTAYGKATQSYMGRNWFETSEKSGESNFEVSPGYHYLTSKSFKTKLRSSGSSQYWYYNLSALESEIRWWEIWFKCGNASEESDLYLNFKNSNGNNIARMKLEYTQMEDSLSPLNWGLELSFRSPSSGWIRLNTPTNGYLYNSWYKIKIEKNGASYINYSLYRDDLGLVDFKSNLTLAAPFSDLAYIEWSNTKEPVFCPMFFWDDHRLGLIND